MFISYFCVILLLVIVLKILFKNTTKYSKSIYTKFLQFHKKQYGLKYSLYTALISFLLLFCIIVQLKVHNIALIVVFCTIIVCFFLWRYVRPITEVNKEFQSQKIQSEEEFTFIFYEKPLQPDSLNLIWDEQLNKADIYLESALRISLTHEDGSVESQKTYQSEWGNSSNLVFTFYIGYACEIEVMGYLHYTLWGMIYKEVLLYLLLYIIVGYGFYTFFIILSRRINSLRSKEIVEIIKETPVEILKEVPVEIIKEVQVEKQIIKEVQRVDIIPLHSYILGESLIFYADQNIIEVNDVKYNIQGQSSLLLELFFQEKDNGYTLKEDFIIEKLWPDNSGNDERMHKAIGRLRSFLRKIDPSLSIINKNGTYRLIISEKSLVKRNS